jgi:Ni,Fe-hydrogenase I large subunit
MASVSHTNKSAIVNYQCVVPNTWNAGQHDAKSLR